MLTSTKNLSESLATYLPHYLALYIKENYRGRERDRRKHSRELKERFITVPILAYWDPDLKIVLEADCSGYSLGACLSQIDKEGQLQPITYFSKKLSPIESNYLIYNKEMLAIIRAIEEWQGKLKSIKDPFIVLTDYKNL